METYFVFIAKASCCLSLFYLVSLVLFRNNHAFKFQRVYLLTSIILSLALPFNKFSINFSKETEASVAIQQKPSIQVKAKIMAEPGVVKTIPKSLPIQQTRRVFPLTSILAAIYWIVAAGLFVRIAYSLIYILVYFIRSERIKEGKYTIIFHPSIGGSFSFLRWIFIHGETKHTGESQSIIKHEIVHANQYHSLDVIAVELLTAVMWFNPLIWLMRKGMQQLHEYLADEGVLRSGTNVLEYQALLVNQVAGDRLICLPSGFKQSLIKKRLVMMTKPSINRKTGYRLMALIPLAGIMFLILSFTNKKEVLIEKNLKSKPLIVYNQTKPAIKIFMGSGEKQEPKPEIKRDSIEKKASNLLAPPPPPPPPPVEVVAAVSPTRMNVFYLGIDNPVDIAVAGLSADKVFPTIDNGVIRKTGNSYIVNPRQLGNATIHVIGEIDGQKKELRTVSFRVKRIPDPVAKVAGRKGGTIDKNLLLAQLRVQADLENFDFDAEFVITEFTVSANVSGYVKDIPVKGDKITEGQKNLIQQVKPGDKVLFTDIKGKGPDGTIREFNTIIFKMEE